MNHAVYVHGIQHVIIDNLQFMIGMIDRQGFDKFTMQDIVVAKFREFATTKNCHVTLIAHPRKVSVY